LTIESARSAGPMRETSHGGRADHEPRQGAVGDQSCHVTPPQDSTRKTDMLRRILPWGVLFAALVAGAWVLAPVLPIATTGPIAAWGVASVVGRVSAFLGAIVGGAFALSLRPVSPTQPAAAAQLRRIRGLRTLGASSVIVGLVGVGGPFVGLGFAHSGAMQVVAAALGALTLWGTARRPRAASRDESPPELSGGPQWEAWPGARTERVRTPAPYGRLVQVAVPG
jgi:hypothetical protein